MKFVKPHFRFSAIAHDNPPDLYERGIAYFSDTFIQQVGIAILAHPAPMITICGLFWLDIVVWYRNMVRKAAA